MYRTLLVCLGCFLAPAPCAVGAAPAAASAPATPVKAVAAISLMADASEITGTAKLVESDGAAGGFVGDWRGIDTSVAWTFNATPGAYDVELVYASDAAGAGGMFGVAVGGEIRLRATVADTGGAARFKVSKLGRVQLAAGPQQIRVKPLLPPKASLMSLSRLTLRPVVAVAAATQPAVGTPKTTATTAPATRPATAPAARDPSAPGQLMRRQATIRGLVVYELGKGKMAGKAIGIVATAQGVTRGGRLDIRGDIGRDMALSLLEAEKYVRVSNPTFGNGSVEVSFTDGYSPKDGGSAGAGFAVALRSLTEGFAIDPAVAITGELAVNGTVQPIGGVAAKLRGAHADGAKIAIIPNANANAYSDVLVTVDRFEVLSGLQVISVGSVDQAVAIARTDRDANTAEALKLYADLQPGIAKRRLQGLKNAAAIKTLGRVLELCPGHVNARYALEIAKGKGPTTLSLSASLIEIQYAVAPFAAAMAKAKEPARREDISSDVCQQCLRDLRAYNVPIHPDVVGLRWAWTNWIDTVDRVLSFNKKLTREDEWTIEWRRQELKKELERLRTDEALIEKLMKEGY